MNNYPENWKEIAEEVKRKNGYRCERCRHPHDPKRGYTLTVHHLDMDKANCKEWNLAALCQRCHLQVQARVDLRQNIFSFYDVAEWFKPHLDGYLRSCGRAKTTKKGGEKLWLK